LILLCDLTHLSTDPHLSINKGKAEESCCKNTHDIDMEGRK